MIEKIKNNKINIRMFIFLGLFVILYLLSFYYLFGNQDIFGSIVVIFGLFIFSHFISLELRIKKIKMRYVLVVFTGLMLINILSLFLFSWTINYWLIAAIIMFNLSLFLLFFSLDSIQFRGISHFIKGGYIFTLFITLTYSFALIGMFQKFPLTCEGLQGASQQLIEFVEMPFTLSAHKTVDQNICYSDIDISIGVSKNDEICDVNKKVEDVLFKVKDTKVNTENSVWEPILQKFNELKAAAVDQIMGQQKTYSTGVCDMLLTQINEKFDLNDFKLSAVLLIYLLLFGFIRLAIFIMSFIGFLLFESLYGIGLYKRIKVKKEVFEIK